ncbi:MAG: hypothetical protein OSJ70_07760 [Bacilli bacterium]|nr:hypothetical protein [Bacilli bacterium]
MNMKVVVIWGFVVLVFAGLGIFGMLNQDILETPPDINAPYVPNDNVQGKSMVCSSTRDNGSSSYRFTLDETTNNIKSVNISYSASNADIDTYTAATNLNNSIVNGVTFTLSGTSTDFALIITANVGSMDTVALESVSADLSKLGIIIEGVTDYETYKTALASAGAYTCD